MKISRCPDEPDPVPPVRWLLADGIGKETDLILSWLIAKFAQSEGSYVRLARAVNRANDRKESEGALVDRRKLKALAARPESVTLTIPELRALDRYLSRFGYSLARIPLFYRPSILKRLSESSCVRLFVGARIGDPRDTVAFTDLETVSKIQSGISNQNERPVRFELSPYFVEDEAELRALEEEWNHNSDDLVSFGSGRANPVSEALLAELLGVPGFASEPVDPERVPFQFVWTSGDVGRSHFSKLDPAGAPNSDAAIHVLRGEGAGVYVHEAPTAERRGKSYGIVAGGVRRNGQLSLVLAGLTGTGTVGTARVLDQLVMVGAVQPGEPSPAFWALVEVGVEAHPKRRDREEVVSAEIVDGRIHIVEGAEPILA